MLLEHNMAISDALKTLAKNNILSAPMVGAGPRIRCSALVTAAMDLALLAPCMAGTARLGLGVLLP